MIGTFLPHRLESAYLRSATLVSQIHKNIASKKSVIDEDECDPIPSMQPSFIVGKLSPFLLTLTIPDSVYC